MVHFNHHWKRGRQLAGHRDGLVPISISTGSSATGVNTDGLIIPVAPTIEDNPFATTTTPSLSPSPVPSSTTVSSAPSLSSTPSSSLSHSLTSTITSITSTTSSSLPVLSTPTTTPIATFTIPTTTQTFIQTIVNPSGVVHTSSSTSPTSTPVAVGGTSSGIIIGGVVAAIFGAAGILAAAVYFLRKCRGRGDEAFAEEIWNRSRQSAILGDGSESTRHFNTPPRPPTMIERHLNNTSAMPPRQRVLPNTYPNHPYGNGYGATNYSQTSFSPGQVVSPHSANPFFSPYAQDVLGSPVSSTVPEFHDPPHSASPALPPQALTREPSTGMGQHAAARQNLVTGGPFSPVVSSPDATDPHYTDLSRSSVTPFQAAQYAEITEKLRSPMSSVLGAIPEDRQAVAYAVPSHGGPSTQGGNTHTESPFADATAVQEPIDHPSYELDDDEWPVPSPNAFQHARIPSLPPTLPQISVAERSFSPVSSLEFPVPLSVHNSPSPFSAEFSDTRAPPPTESNYKSSPLATSTPMQAQASVIPREPKTTASRPDTVYTLYDEEDAYGGF